MRPTTLLLAAALTCTASPPAAHPPSGAAGSPTPAPPAVSALQQDADAVHAAGITGVLAESDVVGSAGRTRRTLARSGVADLNTARPPADGSYIRLGSTTKTYVATIVLQLVSEHSTRQHACSPTRCARSTAQNAFTDHFTAKPPLARRRVDQMTRRFMT